MVDILGYIIVEVLLNTVCYSTGAILVFALSAGAIKPGMHSDRSEVSCSSQISGFTYLLDGNRYLHRRWVVLLGVGAWLVLLVFALVYLAVTDI